MEITCKIIQDLLPLYAEQMLSEESVQLVEEHITECEGCTKIAEELKQSVQLTQTMKMASETEEITAQENLKQKRTFQKISKEIKYRRWLSVAFGVLVTATLLVGAFCWLYRPQYLPEEKAVTGVTKENGMVVVELRSGVHVTSETEVDAVTGKEIVTLTACRKRGELSFGDNVEIYKLDEEGNYMIEEKKTGKQLRFGEETIIWYANSNNPTKDVLLWGEETSSHRTAATWKGVSLYWMICLPLAVMSCFGAVLFKKKHYGKAFGISTVFLVCFPMSLWFSAGTSFLIYDNTWDITILFVLVTILAGLLTGSIVCGEKLYRIQKSEK